MSQLRKILDSILNVLAGVSFLAMVALTCWQVFTRYILKNPSSWSEEMVSYLFGWMALLGASIVVGERGHMNIPILVDRMGRGRTKVFCYLCRGNRLSVCHGHSGFRRCSDYQPCYGTDDFFSGCSCRRVLYCTSPERRTEYYLHGDQYCGNCKRHH